ncbi:LON peptidase substrate-binding domain-containing protein [Nitrospirillum sp. BR 11752]|uniref:LON peptidase substrate-binding domain-containing protein n=1 Tax=Nitrospirillum sp. BR 11752 TaxID=3104293 RepID=UPI002EACB49C|nr:LON peptidase substrate-binding domain-containing protein [Nitrospirillum sp. BR 11752]
MSPFTPSFDRLPASIPVFPLTGALVLPRARLPLNIFEPRYLAMVQDSLAGDRLIGMIQPMEPGAEAAGGLEPPLAGVGCCGRLTAFAETDDGRYLITLSGLCRFRIREEVSTMRGYRRVMADWSPFADDFVLPADGQFDRAVLMAALKTYFARRSLTVNWQALEAASDEQLIATIAMLCPFTPAEKQALLEAPDFISRASMLLALVQMAVHESADGDVARH